MGQTKLEKDAVVEKLKKYFTEEQINNLANQKPFEKILSAEWSDVMIFLSKDGKPYEAKIKFKKYKDGNLSIDFRFKADELKIYETLTYDKGKIHLTTDDINNLKEGTNNKVFDVVKENGENVKVFIEVDKDLNSLFFFKQEWLNVPTVIYGQPLTVSQREGLKNGEKVDFTLESKGGGEKDLVMYFSPKDNKIRFIDKSLEKPIQNKALDRMKVDGVEQKPQQKNDVKINQ